MQALELLAGVEDETQSVASFFDAFDWDVRTLDAETLSAEDFLAALGDA